MGKDGEIKTYFEIEAISAEFPALLTTRGNSFYLKLNPGVVRFWDLKPGDQLNVCINRVKRLKVEE